MSEMSLATIREEPGTADVLIPSPRTSADSVTFAGNVVADEAGVADEGICYPLVRYAVERLEHRAIP